MSARLASQRVLPAILSCSTPSASVQVRSNCWRACLGKTSRSQYLHRYPVRIVRPDGSSIEIKTTEPRQVVQLAVDLKALSDDERRQRLAARKPKAKKIVQEVIDDNFDAGEYMQMFGGSETKIDVVAGDKKDKKAASTQAKKSVAPPPKEKTPKQKQQRA